MRTSFVIQALTVSMAWVLSAGASTEPPKPADYASDPRLAGSISLYGVGVPLNEVLARIQAPTAVHLEAAHDIEQIPVIVLATQRPARDILAALVGCLGLSVRVLSNGGTPTYIVFQPQATRERSTRLAAADLALFRHRVEVWSRHAASGEPIDLRTESEFGNFSDLASTSAENLGSDSHAIVGLVSSLSDATLAQIYSGERLRIPIADLPPSSAADVSSELIDGIARHSRNGGQNPHAAPTHLDLPKGVMENAAVTIWMDTDLVAHHRQMHVRFGGIDLHSAHDSGQLPPGPNYFEAGVSFGGGGPGGITTNVEWLAIKAAHLQRERTVASPPLDPPLNQPLNDVLEAVRELDAVGDYDTTRPSSVFFALSALQGVPIISDYRLVVTSPFLRSPRPFLAADTATLGEAIDWMVPGFDTDWRPIAGIHTFRSRDWYSEDAQTIPIVSLRRWRSEAAKAKTYSVDLLAEIAQLTDTQLTRLLAYDCLPNLRPVLGDSGVRAALRIWGVISAPHRQAALSDQGIPVGALGDQTRAILDELEDPQATSPNSVLTVKPSPSGALTFTLQGPGDERREFEVPQPAFPDKPHDRPDWRWFDRLPDLRHANVAPVSEPPATQ